MSKDVRIQLALDNAEEYIARLSTMSDKELVKKLETIDLQSEIALQKRMDESVELLEIWRSQIIQARILKAENKIPDAPKEIELAIADVETYVAKAEEREEILTNEFSKQIVRKPKIKEDNSDQMSLF
jgi:hypothetical protein